MSHDVMDARDAIDRAKGVSKGLEALVGLLQGNEAATHKADVPLGDIAELLWSLQRDLAGFLDRAERGLKG